MSSPFELTLWVSMKDFLMMSFFTSRVYLGGNYHRRFELVCLHAMLFTNDELEDTHRVLVTSVSRLDS